MAGEKTSMGLEQNIAGLLCYVVGWITGLVFFREDETSSGTAGPAHGCVEPEDVREPLIDLVFVGPGDLDVVRSLVLLYFHIPGPRRGRLPA